MNDTQEDRPERQTGEDAPSSLITDLRLRLQSSQAQQRAARGEARNMARELALTHRLLGFAIGNLAPSPHRTETTAPAPTRAVALEQELIYHLDSVERVEDRFRIAGWAFRPAEGWDANTMATTIFLRHGVTLYYARASRQLRPDVAAHYAGRPRDASGGATGLEGAGFACEILVGSLSPDKDWEILLQLECGGMLCQQATARRIIS